MLSQAIMRTKTDEIKETHPQKQQIFLLYVYFHYKIFICNFDISG